jgi:hypothetical protein
MIEGLIPQINLILIVVCCLIMFICVVNTPWTATVVGRHLFVFITATFLWWGLIAWGTFVGLSPLLQTFQAIAFLLIGVTMAWMAALMVIARYRRLTRRGIDGNTDLGPEGGPEDARTIDGRVRGDETP